VSARSRAVLLLSGGAALFHLWSAGVEPFTALVQRPVHLGFMAALAFLGVGVRKKEHAPAALRTDRIVRAALGALAVSSAVYLVAVHQDLVGRSGSPTGADLFFGAVALVVVLEMARRTVGWGLVVVAALSLAYAAAGPWLPGFLAHRGYGPTRLLEHLYLSSEGIWGVPLGVSADFVYLFVLFGTLLDMAGGGSLLFALAQRVAGRSRGGPAKTAAFASALMGSLSGSAVANVVTTGTFTIPLMRRTGFRPFFAAAIEAAASTGGQLMPPVMGAGAFILATWTGIPYARIATVALLPALLYYAALAFAIHFRAGRMGIEPAPTAGRGEPIVARLHLILPLVAIVWLLAVGRSPMRAAFWGVVAALAVALVRRVSRPDSAALRGAVEKAARGTVQVAAACAAAGIVVGVASLTGIGLRMSELIVTLAGGQLLPALLLTAAGSIVLGMGLPTTAAYVVLAALGAPALTELGVPLLSAHLFIFYFGCISNVTPPVSLAAYAAAGLAGAPPIRTGLTAMVLASAGFLVPFLFVYDPALLLEGTALEVAGSAASALVGVAALAAATMGFLTRTLNWAERAALALAAATLLAPGILSDLFGVLVVVLVLLAARFDPSSGPRFDVSHAT